MKQGDCIGMLDWGIGGIHCYRLLKAQYPDVPVLYLSDTGAVPYGRMCSRELTQRVQQVVNYLIEMDATKIVVACNAASTVLSEVRTGVPCTGVIEHGLSVLPAPMRGTVGVIGGARTIRSGAYRRGLQKRGRLIVSRVAQTLSAHIEAGSVHSAACARDLERIMAPLAQANAIVLACTHYAAIAPELQALAPGATLLDPVPALVDYIGRAWTLRSRAGRDRFVTTGDALAMRQAAKRVWNVSLGSCAHVELSPA